MSAQASVKGTEVFMNWAPTNSIDLEFQHLKIPPLLDRPSYLGTHTKAFVACSVRSARTYTIGLGIDLVL